MRGAIGAMRGLIGVRVEGGGTAVDGPGQGHRGVVDGAYRGLIVAGVEGFPGDGGLRSGCSGAGGGIRGGGGIGG